MKKLNRSHLIVIVMLSLLFVSGIYKAALALPKAMGSSATRVAAIQNVIQPTDLSLGIIETVGWTHE